MMTDADNHSADNERPKLHHMLGSLALFVSVGILFLSLIARNSRLGFMPSSWFSHRTAWYLFGLVSFLFGIVLLKSSAATDEEEDAEPTAAKFQNLVFYTRKDCPLCDEAKETLDAFRGELPEIEVRDIDADPDPVVIEKFGNCVPVVVIDGKVRFRGNVNRTLLRRLIDGTAPLESDSPT